MKKLLPASFLVAALCAEISCKRTEPPPQATPSPAAVFEPTPALPPIPADVEERKWTVYDGPFDDASRLLITATDFSRGGHCCFEDVRVLLIDRADATRQSEIDSISGHDDSYDVKRIDPGVVVLCRTESHGFEDGCFKLFIDPVARRLVKRFGFELQHDVEFASDADAQRVLGVNARDLDVLRRENVFRAKPTEHGDPPAVYAAHPLPQTTYEAFARARPARVLNGYRKDTTRFEEHLGAWQDESGGFWFAKTFYDGEGTTGVGAAGFLSSSGQYSFLEIPGLFDWSVDTLLVEPDAVWLGLVRHPEGADMAGGLLRYDRQTHRTEIQKVPGVIHHIMHLGDAIFLGTTHGLCVFRNGTMTWHHMEPDLSGTLVVITETVTK